MLVPGDDTRKLHLHPSDPLPRNRIGFKNAGDRGSYSRDQEPNFWLHPSFITYIVRSTVMMTQNLKLEHDCLIANRPKERELAQYRNSFRLYLLRPTLSCFATSLERAM